MIAKRVVGGNFFFPLVNILEEGAMDDLEGTSCIRKKHVPGVTVCLGQTHSKPAGFTEGWGP